MLNKIKIFFGVGNNSKYHDKVIVEKVDKFTTILTINTKDIPYRKVKSVFDEIYQNDISH